MRQESRKHLAELIEGIPEIERIEPRAESSLFAQIQRPCC